MPENCKWVNKEDFSGYDSDAWSTDCGQEWTLLDGTPGDNKMNYCLFCGKRIKQILKPTESIS